MAKKAEKPPRPKKVAGRSFFEKYRWETLIFAFAFLLYANSIPNNYNMDDELVTNNHRLTSKGISAIPEIFSSTYYQDNMGYAYEYRPIVLSSFAIENQIFGDNPYVSHFFNVILFAFCCVLLFYVMWIIVGGTSPLFPLAITLLFIAHPAHTEVVDSIKNRDEIFALIFSLLGLYTTVKAVRTGKIWLLLLLPILFTLALLSKLTAVSFTLIIPVVLILFTNAGFATVMLAAILLGIPTFFLVNNIGGVWERLFKEVNLILILLLYVLVNIKAIYQRLVKIGESILSRTRTISGLTVYGKWSNNLTDQFTGIKPDPSVFSIVPAAFALITPLVFFAGIMLGYNALVITAVVALFAAAFWGNERFAWWANISIYVCLLLPIIKYPNLINTLYADLIFMPLICQVHFGNRKLFIPAAILLFSFFCIALFLNPMLSISILCFMLVIRLRFGWVIFIFILVSELIQIRTIKLSEFSSFWSGFYCDLLSILIVLLIFLKKETKYLLWAYKVAAMVLIVLLIGNNPFTDAKKAAGNVSAKVVYLTEQANTSSVISKEQDRPLLYLEQPVTYKDPWQVRAGTSLEIMLQYLHKVILPYPMAFYYGYRFIKPERIGETIPLLSLFLYTLLAILAMIFIWKDRVLALGIIIYLSSLVRVGNCAGGGIVQNF
jgi:hypothetical protein